MASLSRPFPGKPENQTIYTYEYNAAGQRTSKTKTLPSGMSTTTEFIYEGDLLVGQKTSDGKGDMTFLHDDTGAYIGLIYEGVEYYYMKNVQGDIIGIVDAEGVIQAVYTYEPFGKLFSIETKSGFLRYDGDWSVGGMNPIRYRGYYYDYDTKLYYLNSRYYDPYVGRFLNADGYVSTGQDITGYNMFAYCGNNPVNRVDSTGEFWLTALFVTAVVAVCTVALSSCSAQPSSSPEKPKPPSNYVQENSTKQNCYSYAFDLPYSANPGDYSTSGKSDYMFKNKNKYTPAEITEFIKRDMNALNKSVRVVNSPSDKSDNEYIVAMKTSTIVIPSLGVADYHFAVQLSDGSWADKPGSTPSRWNALDGTAIAWDLDNIKNYYNTPTVYFAVER